MPRRTNMKNTKLSLHILKFDASMSCESNEHPVDLCMIIMLFLLCPHLQLQTLESGSSRSSMPVEQSVVWKWDISKGTMGIILGLYATNEEQCQTSHIKFISRNHKQSFCQPSCNPAVVRICKPFNNPESKILNFSKA